MGLLCVGGIGVEVARGLESRSRRYVIGFSVTVPGFVALATGSSLGLGVEFNERGLGTGEFSASRSILGRSMGSS